MTDKRGLTYPIIGPTRVQEKEIVWDDHVAQILRVLKASGVPFKVNNSDLSVKFPGYSKFYVDGSDNIESLRGKSDWGGIGMDEFPFWTSPQYAWEEVVEPNLIVNHAFALIGSSTNGYDYFHRLIKRGDKENTIEGTAFDDDGAIVPYNEWYRSYRHTSYENPYLDKLWLEAKRLTMSEEAFNREYLARFEKFRGLIYKEFDRKVHIQDFDVDFSWRFYRVMDFGAVNPTVCLWIAVDNSDNIYLFDEYFSKGQTAEFHAGVVLGKTSPQFPVTMTFGDPSAQQEMLDYANHGLIITPATRIFDGKDNDWVNSGIEKVRQMLKVNPQTGKPRFFIHPRCVNTIREFESYHWLETKTTLVIKDQPDKVDDHCMDALRYFVVSYTKPDITYDMPTPSQTNSFTGYSQRE